MTNTTLRDDVQELKEAGWEADDLPRAVAKQFDFASYSETLNFLIEMGEVAEEFETMPTIEIEDGTRLNVRIGHEPAPPLNKAEISLAKAIANPVDPVGPVDPVAPLNPVDPLTPVDPVN